MPTHRNKQKTNGKVLPQPCPLESSPISPKGDKATNKAGSVHCRGERAGKSPSRNRPAMGETGPVTDPKTSAKGQAQVFVLGKTKSPLMPCHPARAREILTKGRAAVTRRLPFAIRLRDRKAGQCQPIQVKIDPGAKHTGLSINTKNAILDLFILTHRKEIVVKKMTQRRNFRRRRRTTNIRCREPRFNNRGKGDLPLTKDHVIPRAAGGSHRVSNLTLACVPCNQAKGDKSVAEFLGENSAKLRALQAQLKKPLASSATMNILRPKLVERLENHGLPITQASGAETKWNRARFGLPKTHALDAAMVGPMTTRPKGADIVPLHIQATGRGSYCRTKTDKFGFPRIYLPRKKQVHGFQTGDIVRTPKGVGRIAVRTRGAFDLKTLGGQKTTVSHRHCRLAQRADGYNYSYSSPRGSHI